KIQPQIPKNLCRPGNLLFKNTSPPMPLLTQTKPTLPTGFQVLKNIFSPDELTRARAAQDDLLAGQPNLTPPFHWPAPRDRRHVRSWKMP
ncbi:MAG: hypothetical protein AAGC74_07265, partial [Verrucomicrobiota bacterium]